MKRLWDTDEPNVTLVFDVYLGFHYIYVWSLKILLGGCNIYIFDLMVGPRPPHLMTMFDLCYAIYVVMLLVNSVCHIHSWKYRTEYLMQFFGELDGEAY